jgi:hypothetical protein
VGQFGHNFKILEGNCEQEMVGNGSIREVDNTGKKLYGKTKHRKFALPVYLLLLME